ncbi:MAG: 50S ribosomal protein L15 [Chlamydiae bacterium]|nr:50S ribosomal protein L15 [Chlamydiota bacterium]
MITLHQLQNTHRVSPNVQRIGRGVGSRRGKTSGRGHKGDKSRSGYKRKYGREGGQLPMYRKLPTRGFSNVEFRKELFGINLARIEEVFEDGEVVSALTLIEKGFSPRKLVNGIKILGVGELAKKVVIEAASISKNALKKLEQKKIEFKLV